mgnify:CR=1 FL=1
MNIFAIFGNPVAHSKSPYMHNNALDRLGLKGCYKKFLVNEAKEIKEIIVSLDIKGANITVPFKEDILPYLDGIDSFAKEANAVNTVIQTDGKLYGYNTDAKGFYKTLPFSIKKALILGAGGSAKAIALYLKQRGMKVSVLNRSDARKGFFEDMSIPFFTEDEFSSEAFDTVINSTSSSLNDSGVPFERVLKSVFAFKPIAIDIMYGKPSPFLELASKFGCEVRDGKDMLINQGAYAFELFFDGRYTFEQVGPFFREGFLLA